MTRFSLYSLILLGGVGAVAVACSSSGDDSSATAGAAGVAGKAGSSAGGSGGSTAAGGKGGTAAGGKGGSTAAGGEGGATQTLCEKYGGTANIAKVMNDDVIAAIAGDCKINTFFTSLSPADFTHVHDCLTTQVQELFGCDGISYAGSKDSKGVVCRPMKQAHTGLGISKGDFDALIGDVVAGLTKAGVSSGDIGAAAPALLGMESAIEEAPANKGNTQDMCAGGAGGATP